MNAIWQLEECGWRLLSSAGFPNEATLLALIVWGR